jgi:hypothetical protein
MVVSTLIYSVAVEVRRITAMRTVLLAIIVILFVGGGYPQNSEMTESRPEYPILQPGDVAKAAVILEGGCRSGSPRAEVTA